LAKIAERTGWEGTFNEASAGLPAREAGKRSLPPAPVKISAPRSFKRFAKASRPGDKRSIADFSSPFEKVKGDKGSKPLAFYILNIIHRKGPVYF
jgi:hypothetical protein